MWAATGNHGNQWKYANVILSNTASFRVTFQAEVGGDMWTDIALDDISYTPECMVAGKGGKKKKKITFFVPFLSMLPTTIVILSISKHHGPLGTDVVS